MIMLLSLCGFSQWFPHKGSHSCIFFRYCNASPTLQKPACENSTWAEWSSTWRPHALPITDTRAVRAWHHAWAEGRINLSVLLPTSGSFHVNLLASQSCQELFLLVHLGEDSQWLLELPFLPPSSLHPLKKAFIYRASQACALYCPLELVSLHRLYMEP